jgi:GDPmannose 4,6-dehydratase|tara:strand:- start:661 stop:1308 length:648 start_codon:yes stop_codon:yes gene_type:complete
MFGDNFDYDSDGCSYQDESTSFNPRSPYAIAKVAAHQATSLYRDAYGLFACSGILFNHESERRGEEFLTRKVTKHVADLHISFLEGISIPKLKLGNLKARRDWGYSPDYVEAMWEMLQLDRPEDYVICTGQSHSVKEFVKQAFQCINIYEYQDYIEIDEKLRRPFEVPYLRGDSSKAKYDLGWEPKVTFEELIDKMVINDIQSRDRYHEDITSFE